MTRPSEVEQYPEMDLKLGIKSSLPNVKSTLALLILIWEAMGKPAEVLYSKEGNTELYLSDEVNSAIRSYMKEYYENGEVSETEIQNCISANQLLKSQIEALMVAFELIWKLAKIKFADSTKPFSAERTGRIRYNKILAYTSNMDILGVLFDIDSEQFVRILINWLGVKIDIDSKLEKELCRMLTALSENSVYKLSDDNKDVIFNQNGIYKELVRNDSVDISGDKEAKGSLRILKSLLADGLNPYLNYKGGSVTAINNDGDSLQRYQKRVDTYLSLSASKIIDTEDDRTDDAIEDTEERNKHLFKKWMEMQVKPEGDSDAGNPYSSASIDQYVSNIANTSMLQMAEKSLFYTNDIEDVERVIEVLDKSEKKNNTQKSAVRKYLQYLCEMQNKQEYEDVFSHAVFGIHIKEKNDALSEENPHICIGWSAMGDLSDISSRDQLSAIYDKYFEKKSRGKGQDIGQVWRFLHDMTVGDYVIFAEHSVFHIGRIESDYYYDNSERETQSTDYKNCRKVKWLKKNIERDVLSANMHNSLKTAMSVWTLNDYKSAVVDLLRGTYAKDGSAEMVDEYVDLIFNTSLVSGYERNRIIFGAPGTGKSYGLKVDCEDLLKDKDGSYERVTFHPDYSYSQFVGTYKPVMDADGKSIKYDFVPGPFMRVYVNALKSGRTDNPQPYLLLVEEINRAKVAAVFGDVFQLLDRDDNGVSEYEIQASEDIRRYLAKELGGSPDNYQKIRIPNNMFIWATMNSADQGVFPMDTAFKRRWNFEYLGINENEEEISGIGKMELAGSDEVVEWNILRKAINAKMSSEGFKINEDKLMGPFFLSKKIIASDDTGMIIDPAKFIDAFKSKVIMYLYEDAVKQGKHKFFDGCDSSKYSSVCDAFDEIGMGIFGPNFKENFYDRQRNDA